MKYQLKWTPFPTVLQYTKLDNAGGKANGPVVRIDPKYQNDPGVHAHEYRHVTHWYLTVLLGCFWSLSLWKLTGFPGELAGVGCFLSVIAYSLALGNKNLALRIEADCYGEQFKATPQVEHLPTWAKILKDHYKLPHSLEYIEKRLREQVGEA